MADILGNLSTLPTLPSCSLQFLLSRPVCILGQPTGRWHLPQSWNKSQLDTRSHTARHGQAALRPEKAAINTLRKLNCFSFRKHSPPQERHHPPHLSANKCWPYVQTRWVWLRNPVLVNLYQSPDTLQQLCLIKGLEEWDNKRQRAIAKTYSSLFSPQLIRSFIPTLSPFVFLYIHLTGRQALLAESAMRLMLSIGRKRRSRLSSPWYTLKPSNSYWEYREHWKYWILFNPDGFLTTHSNCKLK